MRSLLFMFDNSAADFETCYNLDAVNSLSSCFSSGKDKLPDLRTNVLVVCISESIPDPLQLLMDGLFKFISFGKLLGKLWSVAMGTLLTIVTY